MSNGTPFHIHRGFNSGNCGVLYEGSDDEGRAVGSSCWIGGEIPTRDNAFVVTVGGMEGIIDSGLMKRNGTKVVSNVTQFKWYSNKHS